MKPFTALALSVLATSTTLVLPVSAQTQQPASPPAEAVPAIGPADPNLRVVRLPNGKKLHLLPATLETTQWGWFDNAQPPVLRINSGDSVALETMMHSHNQVVPGTTIEQIKKLRTDYPGRGPHTLTGPIYVEGAEPGDVLKVTINKIVPRAYATNFNVPGMFGQFPKEYPDGQVKYLYLDWDKKVTEFLPGVEIPLRPFPGTHRSRAQGARTLQQRAARANMPATWTFAISPKARSLYVPVLRAGRLAVDRAIPMPPRAMAKSISPRSRPPTRSSTSRVDVIKGKPLDFPRIETPTSWITMGFDQDLNKAWDQAKAQTVKLLSELRKVPAGSRPEADDHSLGLPRHRRWSTSRRAFTASTPRTAGREDMERPTKETPKYFVSHAKDADLNKAMDTASMGMIKWLENEKKIARLDAYGLASVAMDCRVGAISDTEKNVHCLLPKSIFVATR